MTHLIRRPWLLGLSLVLVASLGCGGGGGGSSASDAAEELIVKNMTPTNGQEVLTTLSDPGLGGVITLSFSERVAPGSILDSSNAFNGLSSDVNVLNSAFERVPGTPTITGDEGNLLIFAPAGGELPNGQYTVTVTRDVTNYAGGRLNGGRYDFRSSFTVGPDQYSPVVRDTFPAPNQRNVDKGSKIIITFNESLGDPNANWVQVVDQNPGNPNPTIAGTLSLARDRFEVVFTPDSPLPPNGQISVSVNGGAGGVVDNTPAGNPFAGIPSGTDVYTFTFYTVTEPPLPNNPTPLPSLTTLPLAVYYCNGTGVGVIDESEFVAGNFLNLADWGVHNYNQANDPTDDIPNPVPNSFTTVGKPDEMYVDPRLNPTDAHTYLYVVDLQSRSVTVMSTLTSRILHRWKELSDPRGIAMDSGGFNLWICNQSSDTVTLFDLATITAGDQSNAGLQALKDVPKSRVDFSLDPTGTKSLGPLSIAAQLSKYSVMVANGIDNSVTELNTIDGTIIDTLALNEGPRDVAASNFVVLGMTPIGMFAWISCEGGGNDASGSVALWWEDWLPLGVNSGKGRIQSLLTGFTNPKGVQYDWGTSGGGLRSAWVANSGGNTVSRMSINISGAGLATTILPSITADVVVGNNPTDVTIDGTRPVVGAPPVIIAAVLGSGQVTFLDSFRLTSPTFSLKLPGVRRIDTWLCQ